MKWCLAGRKLGYTFDNKNFHNVSLGQGQEVEAEKALDIAAKEGHWVILQVTTDSLELNQLLPVALFNSC